MEAVLPQNPHLSQSTPRASYYEVLQGGELSEEIKIRSAHMEEMQSRMSSMRMPRWLAVTIVIVLITVTSGGLILGFGPVYSLLLKEDQWREKCTPEAAAANVGTSCPEQEVHLQYVYSTAFLCLSVAMAFFGLLLDFAGPRLNIMLGLVVSCIGNLLFAFGESTSGDGVAIIAGYTLIAIGGYSTYISSFHFAQLFERQGLVCSFISGFFNASGYMYMLLMFGGVTRKAFFSVYAGVVIVCLVICYVMYPLHTIKKPATHVTLSGLRWQTPIFVRPQGLWKGLREQLRRPDLWYFGLFFDWNSMIFAFAGSAVPSIIYGLDNGNEGVYVNYYFPIIINSAFIYTPIVGYVIDHWGFRPVFLSTLVVMHLFLASLMVHSMQFQIVTLFLYAIAQSSFYSLQFSYIVMCFPGEVYGSLQAFLAVCSFLLSLLNYAFTPWVQNHLDGNYTPVFCIMAGPVLVLYLFLGVVKTGLDKPKPPVQTPPLLMA